MEIVRFPINISTDIIWLVINDENVYMGHKFESETLQIAAGISGYDYSKCL